MSLEHPAVKTAPPISDIAADAGPGDDRKRRRRPRRPSMRAMIKAAKAAGLEITSIECNDDGVRLICGTASPAGSGDDNELDRRMTEQMGVARMGGRKRR